MAAPAALPEALWPLLGAPKPASCHPCLTSAAGPKHQTCHLLRFRCPLLQVAVQPRAAAQPAGLTPHHCSHHRCRCCCRCLHHWPHCCCHQCSRCYRYCLTRFRCSRSRFRCFLRCCCCWRKDCCCLPWLALQAAARAAPSLAHSKRRQGGEASTAPPPQSCHPAGHSTAWQRTPSVICRHPCSCLVGTAVASFAAHQRRPQLWRAARLSVLHSPQPTCLAGCGAAMRTACWGAGHKNPWGRTPPPPAHSTRQLAWKTTGLRSHGDASSSSTAGCRQWMKCRRLLTAALHPAGPRVTEVANHMSGAGAWGPLGQMGSSAENARQLREYGAGSVQVGLTRRGKAGPRLAPRSRTALTGWSNHVQLLVALAPQAHHQPPKTGESGGITGKGRSQPRTCRANAANGKNAGVASGGARTMLGCAQCHGFRLHAGPRGSNMASSCVQQRRWPRADVEVQGELSLAPRIRHAQWAAAATASCLAGFCAPEPGEQTLRGH